jgi:autophagy-related protein 13
VGVQAVLARRVIPIGIGGLVWVLGLYLGQREIVLMRAGWRYHHASDTRVALGIGIRTVWGALVEQAQRERLVGVEETRLLSRLLCPVALDSTWVRRRTAGYVSFRCAFLHTKVTDCKSKVNSFTSSNTDEDDISVFVQDIDSRKPLSGRHKEREKRDLDRQQQQLPSHLGQGHDRYPSEASQASTIKPDRFSSANSTLGRTAVSPLSSAPPSRFSTISAATAIPGSSGLSRTRDLDAQAQMSTSPPALSLSPTRGPMLTNQSDVDERLKRMKETFMKSLEAFPVGRKKDKGKEREREDESSRPPFAISQPSSPSARTPISPHRQSSIGPGQEESQRDGPLGGVPSARSPLSPYSASDDDGQPASYAGRGLSIRPARERAPLDDFGMGHTRAVSMGLGLGRAGRRGELDTPSMDSSLMGRSDVVGGSGGQASDEMIGKMELYEERKRRGFY